jgi:hypothetical protein
MVEETNFHKPINILASISINITIFSSDIGQPYVYFNAQQHSTFALPNLLCSKYTHTQISLISLFLYLLFYVERVFLIYELIFHKMIHLTTLYVHRTESESHEFKVWLTVKLCIAPRNVLVA